MVFGKHRLGATGATTLNIYFQRVVDMGNSPPSAALHLLCNSPVAQRVTANACDLSWFRDSWETLSLSLCLSLSLSLSLSCAPYPKPSFLSLFSSDALEVPPKFSLDLGTRGDSCGSPPTTWSPLGERGKNGRFWAVLRFAKGSFQLSQLGRSNQSKGSPGVQKTLPDVKGGAPCRA